jgi:hypothetical protein
MQKLVAVAFLGALCASPALVVAATPATQIVQQRTADGRLLLTDHPAAGAKTERTWQVDREDPAAARQRAIDVKAEANLVTERVQRMLDQQQQRRNDEDALRVRMAMADRERSSGSNAQDGIGYGYGYGGGYGGALATPFRASPFIGPRIGEPPRYNPIAPINLHGRPGGHGKSNGSGSHGSHSR